MHQQSFLAHFLSEIFWLTKTFVVLFLACILCRGLETARARLCFGVARVRLTLASGKHLLKKPACVQFLSPPLPTPCSPPWVPPESSVAGPRAGAGTLPRGMYSGTCLDRAQSWALTTQHTGQPPRVAPGRMPSLCHASSLPLLLPTQASACGSWCQQGPRVFTWSRLGTSWRTPGGQSGLRS